MHPDYCTHAPDLNFGTTCCKQHDLDYEDSSPLSRAEADARLRKCISDKGYIVLPWIYWIAVRIFGNTHYKQAVLSKLPKISATTKEEAP